MRGAELQDEAAEQHAREQGLGTRRVGREVPGTRALGKICQCAVPKQRYLCFENTHKDPDGLVEGCLPLNARAQAMVK